MERDGEALGELGEPGGDAREPSRGRDEALGQTSGDVVRQRRAGERITVPWRISGIRLLGALELHVVDEPGRMQYEGRLTAEGPQVQRELSIVSVRGFGPMAKAAFIALILNLKTGRTSAQLGEAMEGSLNPPLALQTHLSAVRRTGLRIGYRAGIYRVEDLERSQVDALQFEDIYKRLKLVSLGRDNDDSSAIIASAELALAQWGGILLLPTHISQTDLR